MSTEHLDLSDAKAVCARLVSAAESWLVIERFRALEPNELVEVLGRIADALAPQPGTVDSSEVWLPKEAVDALRSMQ